MRYLGFEEDPGERYTVADLDFDRDPPRLAAMAKVYNVTDLDLDAFRRRGGKLLMWHSWADAGPSPMKSIAYYEAVENRVGGREETQAFFRLFMPPGMDHCGVGKGPGISDAGYDPLTALERWVEHKAGASEPADDEDRLGGEGPVDAPGLPLSPAGGLYGSG